MNTAAVQRPRTYLLRVVSALLRRDLDAAITVLAEAGRRQALPRRVIFGARFDRPCAAESSEWSAPPSEAT